MPVRRLLPLLLVASLLGSHVAADEPAIPWPPWASAYRTAFERWSAGDPAPLRSLVGASSDDALVALTFATLRTRARTAEAADALGRAARETARIVDGAAREPWLAPLVERWLSWDETTAELERRGMDLITRAVEPAGKEQWRTLLDLLTGPEAAAAAGSAWSVDLQRQVGYAWMRLGRTKEEQAEFDEAIRRAEASGLRSILARTWSDVAESGIRTRDDRAAEEATDHALAIYEWLGDARRIASAHRVRGVARLRRGLLREAIADTETAIEIATKAADAGEVATARRNLAEILAQLGRYAEAGTVAAKARAELLALGRRFDAASALSTLARAEQGVGRYADALGHLEQALEEAKGDAAREATVVARIGVLRLRMGDADGALVAARRAREMLEALGDARGAAMRRGDEGAALRALGRVEEALVADRAALAAHRASGGSDVGGFTTAIAVDLRELGRFEESREAFEESLRAERRDDVRLAAVKDHYGRLLRDMGRPAEALEMHRAAEAANAEVGARDLQARAAREVATDLLALGRPDEALVAMRRALDLGRDVLEGVGEDEAEGLLVNRAFAAETGLKIVREIAAKGPPGEAVLREALAFAEDGRARVLSAGLERRREVLDAVVPAERLEEEAAARARLERVRAEAARGRATRVAVDEAYGAYDEARRRVLRSSRRAAMATPPAPEPAAVMGALREGEALVLLLGIERDICALVVRNGSIALRWIPTKGVDPSIVGSWTDLAGTPGAPDAGPAERLYDLLLRPLEPDLAGATRWIIAPDGMLSTVPYGALVRRDGERTQRLVERVEVCLVPSGTVLAILRDEAAAAPKGRGIVALGDPAGVEAAGLAPLPGSGAEARAVAELHPADARTLLLGPAATAEALRAALDVRDRRWAVLHLACHATIDLERPRLSALRLVDGRPLGADDLATWRLPVDLAVVSACETSRGKVMRGEGVLGFPRGFFLAGVPRVVVSSWRVADDSAGPLLRRFHELHAKEGLPAGAALRKAQLERLRAGGELAHPYHWAGFALWGIPD